MTNFENSENRQSSPCSNRADVERPLITFALLAYNQERYIEEAVLGALSQTYTPLEVILSDDCSPDGTFAIMERLAAEYRGPHSVVLNRNSANLGLVAHVNCVTMSMARSELIVLAAGDDISLPERTERSWNIMRDFPNIHSLSFAHRRIDRNGNARFARHKIEAKPELRIYSLTDYLTTWGIPTAGCARIFRRSVMDAFGPLSERCPTEDSTIRLRSLLLGEIGFCTEVQVRYRIHDANLSSAKNITKMSQKLIYKQYLRDTRVARRRGLINREITKTLNKRLRINIERNCALHPLNERLTLYTLFALLRSDAFGHSEKMRIIKNRCVLGCAKTLRNILRVSTRKSTC